MRSKQLCSGLWCIHTSEAQLHIFGTMSFSEAGRSYNAYLMDTGDGFLLLGSMPTRFSRQLVYEVQRIAGNNVKWALFFGADDDREAAREFLRVYPKIVIISGMNNLYKMVGFTGVNFSGIEIRSNRTLVLGGKTLICHILQDKGATASLYVVDQASGTLFTADAFGAVCALEAVLVSELTDKTAFWQGVERYCQDVSAAERTNVMKRAAALVQDFSIVQICPACGPVINEALDELLERCTAFDSVKPEQPVAALVYAPGNYTAEIAGAIAEGIRDSGSVMVDAYDLSAVNRECILKKLPQADAFLFGTPEVEGDAVKAVWDIVTSLRKRDCAGKLAAVFTSSSSVGNAAENLRQRLAQIGLELNLRDHLLQGKPDEQAMKNAYEYGFGFGCALQRIPNSHKPLLVRCLVCGEVFDASLGICPVCGVGLDQCESADENEVVFRKDTDQHYLILGGGIAAVSAAEAIRSRDKTGSITMLSAENYLPINRPMLTKDLKLIAENPDSIQIHDQRWYDEQDVSLKLGVAATTLDVRTKTVFASDGISYNYDKLVYATGAECFVPPFEGWDKPGVLTVRHLWDSRELQKRMETAKRAVVIGGGVLGLEAASELMRAGIKVTVLEAAPQIVGRQIDAQSATRLKLVMERMGVACYEGVTIAAIEGEEQATGVRLADGRAFPADFVLVSCGNRGNVNLAQEAGVSVDRAIIVNQRMETNVADVYACGDCCQLDGVNYQLWQEASEQGRVAGANAAGERVKYANRPLGLSLEGFGTTLFAMGDPGKKPNVPYKTVETQDHVRGRMETYWFFGESLEGAVVIGAPEKTADISQAVAAHARYSELF